MPYWICTQPASSRPVLFGRMALCVRLYRSDGVAVVAVAAGEGGGEGDTSSAGWVLFDRHSVSTVRRTKSDRQRVRVVQCPCPSIILLILVSFWFPDPFISVCLLLCPSPSLYPHKVAIYFQLFPRFGAPSNISFESASSFALCHPRRRKRTESDAESKD